MYYTLLHIIDMSREPGPGHMSKTRWKVFVLHILHKFNSRQNDLKILKFIFLSCFLLSLETIITIRPIWGYKAFIFWFFSWTEWRCLFNDILVVYDFGHFSHTNGFSPVWERKCLFKSPFRINALLQISHWWGFNSAWCSKWYFSCTLRENPFWHLSHTYCFSPVCVRKCLFKFPDCENDFKHSSQTYGFSLVCVRRCCLRLPLSENANWQHSLCMVSLLYE